MDVHHAHGSLNPAHSGAHVGAHYFQSSHPQNTHHQPAPHGYPQGYVQYPAQYYAQPGPPQGSYATPATTNYHTAPPPNNALRYAPLSQQQYSLPVHHGNAIPRRTTQPQLPPAPPALPVLQQQHLIQPEAVAADQSGNGKQDKHLKGLRCILEPPDKELWRQRLFDVDGLMVMTEDQYAMDTRA
jgi:hypothetical protein